MSHKEEPRPEAQSLSAAAGEVNDSIVHSAQYAKDRVTAPASGDTGKDQHLQNKTEQKADEAKEHGKGLVNSISDGLSYVGQRFTASPSGDAAHTGDAHKQSAKQHAENAKGEAGSFFSRVGDRAQEKYDEAGNKIEESKEQAKKEYEETQQSIADQIATNPAEEARAQGEIPFDSATVKAVSK